MAGAPLTHRGDEPVQRLTSLRVLDRDGAKVIAEPDGRDDAARMAVGYVLLRWGRREGGRKNQTYKPCLMAGGGGGSSGDPTRRGLLLSCLEPDSPSSSHPFLWGPCCQHLDGQHCRGHIFNPFGCLKIDHMTWKQHQNLRAET